MNAYTLVVFQWLQKSLFWDDLIALLQENIPKDLICSLMRTIVATCYAGSISSMYVLILSEALKNVDYEQILLELEKECELAYG